MTRSLTNRGVSRRELLYGAGGLVLTASLTACDLLSTDPDEGDGDSGSADAAKAGESPMLAERVEQGELPPAEERLPATPLVVEPADRIGVYGGEWHTATLGAADLAWGHRTIGYEHLMTWNPEWTEVAPNIAESLDRNEEGTEFTFHLREGMKWSDGEPFTADDIVFAYEDVFLNETLSPTPPAWLTPGGEPGQVEKVDDVTVRFTFTEPHGLFLENLAQPEGEGLTNKPRHYLEQFHEDHNPEVEQLVQEEGFADWSELFLAMASAYEREGLPRLTPWIVTSPVGEGSRMVAERNPYYWKTDPEGSQLPYLDQVVFDVVEEVEVMVLKATNGELDMHARHITTPQNKPVLAQSREAGGYHFVEVVGASMNNMIIALNLTHQDEAKREFLSNKDVRIGLSHAINREEIINAVYQRQGESWQAAPRPESEFFNEELAKQYTEFDVARANEYLDGAGYTERDGDGFRLGPDGNRLSFDIDVVADAADRIDSLELIRQYWRDVGVDMRANTMDRSLQYERQWANEHDASVWGGDGGGRDAISAAQWYFPFHNDGSRYAVPWANWFTDEEEPKEEPPDATKRQMELYDQLRATPEAEGRAELFQQILEISQEEFYVIGTVLPPVGYAIVKDDFHNVPESMPNAWMYPGPGPTRPEQYFISP